jgi:WD40 repeat protein
VFTGSGDFTARLWDAASGKEVHRFEGDGGVVYSVAFSPDGNWVLTGSDDDRAQLWDASSGKELRRFVGHSDRATSAGTPGWVTSIAFSPDGNQVLTERFFHDQQLTGSFDNMARLWNASSGKEVGRFEGHTSIIWSVAFSPDGGQILTGSGDGTARLWRASSGKEIRHLKGHAGDVCSVAFSPDGKHILTGSADCTSRIWDAATGEELCTLVSFTNGDWAVVDPEGRFDASNGGAVEGLHWVVGDEPIALSRFKERYNDPGLLAKKLGFNKEPLRKVAALNVPD